MPLAAAVALAVSVPAGGGGGQRGAGARRQALTQGSRQDALPAKRRRRCAPGSEPTGVRQRRRSLRRAGLEAEQRRQDQQRRACRPRLRPRRRREGDRDTGHCGGIASEDLGQAVLEVRRRREDRAADRGGRVAGGRSAPNPRRSASSRAARRFPCDTRAGCSRPRGAQRAHAPAREQLLAQKAVGGRGGLVRHSAAPTRASARCWRTTPSTWRFSPSRASAWQPRSGIQKSRRTCSRSASACVLQALGEHTVAPDLPRQPRAPSPRVVDVALDLAGRDRPARERPVGELDRVPAVLPALVEQPGGDVASLVLDVAVAVDVAAVLDPEQRCTSVGLQLADERVVARPAVVLVQQHQEQRCGVGAAEVGRMRPLPRAVSSPKRSSCRILPGSCSWKSSRTVACRAASTRSVVAARPGR